MSEKKTTTRAKTALAGERYGRLTVLRESEQTKRCARRVDVRCDCGTEKTVYATNLQGGRTESCGCLMRERTGDAHRTHGKCLAEWSELTGIGSSTISDRLKRGWSIERALTAPVQIQRK